MFLPCANFHYYYEYFNREGQLEGSAPTFGPALIARSVVQVSRIEKYSPWFICSGELFFEILAIQYLMIEWIGWISLVKTLDVHGTAEVTQNPYLHSIQLKTLM